MVNLIPIIVLDDGDTYSGVDGASICLITNEQHEELMEGMEPSDLTPVFELGFRDFTLPGREPVRIESTPEDDGIDWKARCLDIAAGIANGEEWAIEACDRIHAEHGETE